jgi:Family of unknown function (DUF6292)
MAGPPTDMAHGLERGLAGYVHAVAVALRVPAEATGFEISDTVTAYLGLAERWTRCPGRDLMLVWNRRDGWHVAVETDPTEAPLVVGYLDGPDILPEPAVVARFVAGLLDGTRPAGSRPAHPTLSAADLATRLSRYAGRERTAR